MATKEQLDFIERIASLVQKYAPQYGIRVVSTIVAQAINESGYGTSDLGQRHNYFGLKCRSNWTGKSYSKETKEEYVPGYVSTIIDKFRVYDSMEDGVKGYFEFLFDPIAGGRYDNLKGITDPIRYAQTIKDDGYCTRSNYVQELTKLIDQYDLTRFDTIGGQNVSGTKLYVIAGHGAGDPGAGGNGYNEAERVRALAKKMKELAPDNVILGDLNRNYYADAGINSLNLPKDTLVIELHLDSATAAAKGGHVIIKYGFNPDWFDDALAKRVSQMFPGRANSLVGRSDLANVNRAASRGINYRLLENCFITNAGDMNLYNEKDTENVARNILAAAGIAVKDAKPEPQPAPYAPHDVKALDFAEDPYQCWYIKYGDDGIADGAEVAFRNQGSWEWLSDPNSSTTRGVTAQCWGGLGNGTEFDDPRAPQWFTLEGTDKPGVFKVHPNVAPHLSLDTSGNLPAAGTQIQFWDDNKSEAQEFFLFRITGNLFRIVSCSGMKCLTVV